ncbi:MAG: tRNA (N6-threonylcarbamoyladenosine(37)-N6)-methyltransferase TrmO [Spirochaetales bacterium]|nr:tRNA (N6-threonylcarbamoyladenosine(37)-N6)-methyltransferase TrmO [Spirochaetales bacterium]
MQLKTIAHIKNMYKEKFGIPRQSGMTEMVSKIVFDKEFRDINALRGLEGFSHLWLIWGFSKNEESFDESFRPTVRPPRLGGNTRVGVFATRSPFRPNPLGLSSVRLKQILETDEGPVIEVIGADLLDGTPIYDIKPYLASFDSHSDAKSGFVDEKEFRVLKVILSDEQKAVLGPDATILEQTLSQDPRPQYQDDPDRVYGMRFSDYEIRFTVRGDVLTVLEVSLFSPEAR